MGADVRQSTPACCCLPGRSRRRRPSPPCWHWLPGWTSWRLGRRRLSPLGSATNEWLSCRWRWWRFWCPCRPPWSDRSRSSGCWWPDCPVGSPEATAIRHSADRRCCGRADPGRGPDAVPTCAGAAGHTVRRGRILRGIVFPVSADEGAHPMIRIDRIHHQIGTARILTDISLDLPEAG